MCNVILEVQRRLDLAVHELMEASIVEMVFGSNAKHFYRMGSAVLDADEDVAGTFTLGICYG